MLRLSGVSVGENIGRGMGVGGFRISNFRSRDVAAALLMTLFTLRQRTRVGKAIRAGFRKIRKLPRYGD